MDYREFLDKKLFEYKPCGFQVSTDDLNPMLFDWQKMLVRWALYKGRAALFEDCGLGKTPQQLEWAYRVHMHTGGKVLIYAPLAVSQQTVREGHKFGIKVHRCADQEDVIDGINITNYERLDKFDPATFVGIVLDESSIIKDFTGKFRNKLIEAYASVPYKLACSATPSPNDYTELGNTAEFLGVMSRSEMLSMFFINDSGDTTASWRLKGHVADNKFWEWLSAWCVVLQKPSDLGFEDAGFILPPLNTHEHVIPADGNGWFVEPAEGLSGIRESMRETMDERCQIAADIVNGSSEQWCVWCSLNPESELLTKLIDGAVEVKGADASEHKEAALLGFAEGEINRLVTKPKIAMWGLNFQNCSHSVVTGLSHSYEQFYQLVRRFYRFGQDMPVNIHIVIGEREMGVLDAIKRKEKQMADMFAGMVRHMQKLTIQELQHTSRKTTPYRPAMEMVLPKFLEAA